MFILFLKDQLTPILSMNMATNMRYSSRLKDTGSLIITVSSLVNPVFIP